MNKTIFLALCSLEDDELDKTIINAIESAKDSSRIKIHVVHTLLFKNPKEVNRIKNNLGRYLNQVSYEPLSLTKYIGVGNGRIAAHSKYNKEDYFLQLDSHTMFDQDWDEKIIDIYEDSRKIIDKEKIILTAYIAKYLYNQNRERVLKYPSGWMPTTATLHNGRYSDKFGNILDDINEKGNENQQLNIWKHLPQWNDDYTYGVWGDTNKKYLPAYKLSGGFQFGSSQFAKDYLKMYPLKYYFFEEEFITTVEAIDHGYSLVFPNMDLPFAHLYGEDINEYGGYRSGVGGNIDLEKRAELNLIKYLNDNANKVEKWGRYANFDYKNKIFLGTMEIPKEFLSDRNSFA